jgi:hypothetical protein
MVREPKNIDFRTTGRHLSEEEFVKISEWINKQNSKNTKNIMKPKLHTKPIIKKKRIVSHTALKER